MPFQLCKNNHVLLLLLLSPFLLQGVVAVNDDIDISDMCQTCMKLWEACSVQPNKKKCKKECDKEQKKDEGEMILTPVCDKKQCCGTICKKDEAHAACKKTKHCSKQEYNRLEELAKASTSPPSESPSASPSQEPTEFPTQFPTSLPTPGTAGPTAVYPTSMPTSPYSTAKPSEPLPPSTPSPTADGVCPNGRPPVMDLDPKYNDKLEYSFGNGNDRWAMQEIVDICNGSRNKKKLKCPMGDDPIGCWNITGVESLKYLFYDTDFNEPIDLWDVSSVTEMALMFTFNVKFNQPLNSWDVSKVTRFESMFEGASEFDQPLDSWNTKKAKDLDYMFKFASKYNQPMNSWDVSKVTAMRYMFNTARNFNQPLDSWNVSKVGDMWYLFENGDKFNQNLDSWDISLVTRMSGMFKNAPDFNQCLSKWPNLATASGYRSQMFYNSGCPNDVDSTRGVGPWCQTEAEGCSFTLTI